jgi:DNA-directed RNA polymerase specialized sigma24 family protein
MLKYFVRAPTPEVICASSVQDFGCRKPTWSVARGVVRMSGQESVTHWIVRLQTGDAMAAQKLWERYFHRLVGLARGKLAISPRRVADEEDVALSAFNSFFQGVERGRFPQLTDRNNLWRLLVVLTARKVCHLIRDENRQKRGGHANSNVPPDGPSIEEILSREPEPPFAAQVAEECQRLLERLGDAGLRDIALWKMEGYTNEEIATRLDCAPRTVERKLRLIRSMWENAGAP